MRTYRLSSMVRMAGVLGALLLAACGSGEDESARAGGCWDCGGQTGSLIPQCGLTPNTMARGVPASASGIVVLPEQCGDARLLDALTVRDASGQPVPFTAERLPNGEILIEPTNGLMPGSYTVSVGMSGDEDGGVAPITDAGLIAPVWQQQVDVRASSPLPVRFGTVSSLQSDCTTILELTPDAPVLPFLGVLSVDISIDGGPTQTLIVTGTMKLFDDGAARVELPDALVRDLDDGEHELRITVQLAGESTPLETFLKTLHAPCELSEPAGYSTPEQEGCNVSAPRRADAGYGWASAWLALIAIALRKRRRG